MFEVAVCHQLINCNVKYTKSIQNCLKIHLFFIIINEKHESPHGQAGGNSMATANLKFT